MELNKIFEALVDCLKELRESTFRILEKITANETKKADEMKKLVRVCWVIAGELLVIILILGGS